MRYTDVWQACMREPLAGVTAEAVMRAHSIEHAVGAMREIRANDPRRFSSTYGHVVVGLASDNELRYDLGERSYPSDAALAHLPSFPAPDITAQADKLPAWELLQIAQD